MHNKFSHVKHLQRTNGQVKYCPFLALSPLPIRESGVPKPSKYCVHTCMSGQQETPQDILVGTAIRTGTEDFIALMFNLDLKEIKDSYEDYFPAEAKANVYPFFIGHQRPTKVQVYQILPGKLGSLLGLLTEYERGFIYKPMGEPIVSTPLVGLTPVLMTTSS